MARRTLEQTNEHGRKLIDNEAKDYAPYLVKRLTVTQLAYCEFLSDLLGDLSSMDTERLVTLAVKLHTDFQAGTWWHERKHEYRPGNRFNDGKKSGPVVGMHGKAMPKPEPKARPKRNRRERDAGIPSPY
jgi:hypothetical protein